MQTISNGFQIPRSQRSVWSPFRVGLRALIALWDSLERFAKQQRGPTVARQCRIVADNGTTIQGALIEQNKTQCLLANASVHHPGSAGFTPLAGIAQVANNRIIFIQFL